ncbi:M23 family metallopeptidase [Nannocystis pusilla]|uniref:M23 family metallopeptidase n=1 Tax=Nannocystis pusilla TaxID=889268 RepID=UPI003DA42F67
MRGQTVHTLYGHMNVASPLAVGTQVTARQTVGTVGMTGGVSSGNHLHFEVMPGGTPGRPNLARGHSTVDPHTFDFPDGGGGQPAETGGGPWSYPFEGNENQKANEGTFLGVLGGQEGALARTDDGFYPIGGNSLWHGGIHFDEHSKATLDQEKGVRCIREGEIVAYRVDSEYPHVEFPNGARALFSRGFVLVRHRLEIPDGEPDKRPKLVFYSLYMHQLDFKAYKDDSKLTRPEHWRLARSLPRGRQGPRPPGARRRAHDHRRARGHLRRGRHLQPGADPAAAAATRVVIAASDPDESLQRFAATTRTRSAASCPGRPDTA